MFITLTLGTDSNFDDGHFAISEVELGMKTSEQD